MSTSAIVERQSDVREDQEAPPVAEPGCTRLIDAALRPGPVISSNASFSFAFSNQQVAAQQVVPCPPWEIARDSYLTQSVREG